MTTTSGPQLIDYERAVRLLLHTNPVTGIDVPGVNQILGELGDGRAGQCLMALSEVAHEVAPILHTEEGVAALRMTLAKYQLMNDKEGK